MKKTLFDDGFQGYLVENADFVGDAGIPMLLDLNNEEITTRLVPFDKINITQKRAAMFIFISMILSSARFCRQQSNMQRS